MDKLIYCYTHPGIDIIASALLYVVVLETKAEISPPSQQTCNGVNSVIDALEQVL